MYATYIIAGWMLSYMKGKKIMAGMLVILFISHHMPE